MKTKYFIFVFFVIGLFSCKVDVVQLEKIEFNISNLTLELGTSSSVDIKYYPADAENVNIEYSCTQSGIVEITDKSNYGCAIKAISPGSTILVASSNEVKAYLEIKVEDNNIYFEPVIILPYVTLEMKIGEKKNIIASLYGGTVQDNTNFTFLQATLCDTAAVYGPCAAAFGMEPWHEAINDAFSILTGKTDSVSGYDKWEQESLKDADHPLVPYNTTQERVLRSYMGNEQVMDSTLTMQGRLLGGCMDCLVNLVGTRFDKTVDFIERYKEDGVIWFLEACELNVFGIRRAMWQMEEAGWFEHVKGFLIGRPMNFGQEMMGLDAYQAVLEVAGRRNVPVIMDVDLGHLPPMMPIIVGSLGEVNVQGNDIAIKMHKR